MDSVKSILVNYAVCALLGSIFEFVSPKKSKEIFRMVSSIIMISVIVIPIAILDFKAEFAVAEEENVDFEKESLLSTANLLEREIYKRVENVLINEGVNEYEIYISTSVDEAAKEITLTEVRITVDAYFQEKIENIKEKLKGDFQDILEVGVK